MKKCSIYKKTFFVCLLFISLLCSSVFSKELIPCGKTVGITVKTGACVLDTAEFEDGNGQSVSPAKEAGIKSGDVILKIGNKDILSASDLSNLNELYDGKISVLVLRDDKEMALDLNLKKSKEGSYKLGVFVKDNESGIGTVTFIDPETKEFGALGHGICRYDLKLVSINGGSLLNIDLTSVKKGKKGSPGELVGIFSGGETVLGEVCANTNAGVYGLANDDLINSDLSDAIEIAERETVKEGEAKILSNIEGKEVKEYSAKITRINDDETNTKGMIVKITDKELLEKTGGIVQGMSGSPILQDGKLVGAVTHVFVNDPTRGYGIFIEKMLENLQNVAKEQLKETS